CSSPPPPTTALITLSLHDALPILLDEQEAPLHVVSLDGEHPRRLAGEDVQTPNAVGVVAEFRQLLHTGLQLGQMGVQPVEPDVEDRKSTRLNSSHVKISYAVFCLK